jgi:hypothetical protein
MAEQASSILSYSRKLPTASSQLAMNEIEGGVLVSLAVAAKWVPWASICGQFLWALGAAGSAVTMVWFWREIRQMFHGLAVEFSKEFWLGLGFYLGFTIMFCLTAAHSLTMHLRWGQVPRKLKVTQGGLTLSWLGFRGMRERHWKADEVLSLDLKKVKDIFTRRTVYRMRICFRSGWPRVILISTKDAVLASRIRDRIGDVLRK